MFRAESVWVCVISCSSFSLITINKLRMFKSIKSTAPYSTHANHFFFGVESLSIRGVDIKRNNVSLLKVISTPRFEIRKKSVDMKNKSKWQIYRLISLLNHFESSRISTNDFQWAKLMFLGVLRLRIRRIQSVHPLVCCHYILSRVDFSWMVLLKYTKH